MDVRRRTLVSEGPLGNAMGSSSLAPPSAMKKPGMRLGRPSMIPQATGRQSIMPGATGLPTLSHSASQEQLRKSSMMGKETIGNRGDEGIYGRTPQSNRLMPGR